MWRLGGKVIRVRAHHHARLRPAPSYHPKVGLPAKAYRGETAG